MRKGTKLPKKDVVLFVIREIIQRYKKIESQREFTDLVNENLKRVDTKLAISGKRLRMLSLKFRTWH